VLEDSQGRLWVGVYNGGLSRLDPGQTAFRHFINDKEDPRSLPNNIVTKVYEDSSRQDMDSLQWRHSPV
jgi:ligand-binding sensor domain-containing protein